MISLSNSLIKSYNVNIGNKDSRVIDSNQAIFDRLQVLSEILEQTVTYEDGDFADEFTEGLNAEQVDALLDDSDKPQVSSEELDQMIYEANAEAERIIESANEQARSIVEQAQMEAEQLKKQGYEEGVSAGNDAGYREGLERVSAIENELNEKSRQLDADYEGKISELEPRFVELLTDIYSHVFRVDLSDKSELILNLLRDAIRNVESGKNFFVHVSDNDYEYVNEHKDELMAGLASTCTVEVIEDVSLTQGKCFIEAESGIFDCSLDIELENIKKELRLLSYSMT